MWITSEMSIANVNYIRNEHEEFNHQYLGGSGIPAAGIGRQPVRIKRIVNITPSHIIT